MRFFWPNKLNPNPGVFTRLGRVIHWIATVPAAIMLAGAAFFLWQGLYTQFVSRVGYYSGSPEGYFGMALGALTFAVVLYFAGRALRYIFSGE